uniref:Uncharacterized protein n=1 Tax=Anguilla anguilla TaxID=7936 RepID=A0A0E9UJY9_ANGAN
MFIFMKPFKLEELLFVS